MNFDETDVLPPRHDEQSPGAVPRNPWHDSWSAALTRVELDVAAAEELLLRLHAEDDDRAAVVAPPAWSVPALPGPMPREFADRARQLLDRQLDVSERLASAMTAARAQTNALRKFNRAEARPVFVDRAL